MSIAERARGLFSGSRKEKRQALDGLADQVMPEFKSLTGLNANDRNRPGARKLRQYLQDHKALVAVVDGKRPEMIGIIQELYGSTIYLTVFVNADKFLQSDLKERNDSFAKLLDEFSELVDGQDSHKTFHKFQTPIYLLRSPEEDPLKAKGINPKRVAVRLYD